MKQTAKKGIKLFLNGKFLLTYGIAGLIMHGWSFVFVIIGPMYKIEGMIAVGTTGQTLLGLPNGFGIATTLALAIPLQLGGFRDDKELIEQLNSLKVKKNKK